MYAAAMLLASLLAVAFVAPASVPQQAEAATVGRILGMDDKPVANAEVTFLSRPLPRSYTAGEADRRVAKTDERGRYRVKLARDRRYTAWATWADGATNCLEGVTGGEFVELKGVPDTEPFTLELSGMSEWPEPEQYGVRVLVGGQNIDFVAARREGNVFHVPSLPPFASRPFQVLNKVGTVVWAHSIGSWAREVERELPTLRDWAITVVDEAGEPVPDAKVRWHIRNYWYTRSETLPAGQRFQSLWPVMGTTNKDGETTISLPETDHRYGVWLLTEKDGYRMSQDGTKNGRVIKDGQDGGEWDSENLAFRVVLKKAEPKVLDLRDADGAPTVAGWVQLGLRVNISVNRGGMGTIFTRSVPVVDGKAVMKAPVPERTEVELVESILAEGLRSRLREKHGIAPAMWRSTGPSQMLTGDGGQDPFGLEGVTPVQVTAVDGRPAARVAVMMKQRVGGMIGTRTDRVGRALLPGPASDGRLVVAADDQGYAIGKTTADGELLKLQLEAFERVELRIEDPQGAPAADVAVWCARFQNDDGDKDLKTGLGAVMNNRSKVVSDAKGRAYLMVPPVPCRVWLSCSRKVDSGNVVIFAADGRPAGVHRVVVQESH